MASLTHSLMPSFCGSLMSLAGMMPGPSGQASSKHFWPTQSHLNGEEFRQLVALAEIARGELVRHRVTGDVVERLGERHVLRGLADHRAEFRLPVDRVGGLRQLHRGLVSSHRARRLDEMPRLQPDLMRVRRRRDVLQLRHLHHVIGVVGAGAIDRRWPQHRRKQLGAPERPALQPALAGRRRGLLQHVLCRGPLIEDRQHAGIARLARECGGVEQLVADRDPGARAFVRLIGDEHVAGHGRQSPRANERPRRWGGEPDIEIVAMTTPHGRRRDVSLPRRRELSWPTG